MEDTVDISSVFNGIKVDLSNKKNTVLKISKQTKTNSKSISKQIYIDKNKDTMRLSLQTVFKGALDDDSDLLANNMCIRVFLQHFTNCGEDVKYQINRQGDKVAYFRRISEVVEFLIKPDMVFYNNYYSLGLVDFDNQGGKAKDVILRTVLFFDFDFKNCGGRFDINIINKKFSDINIKYTLAVNSGNGYHVYILIKPTRDIEKVAKVNKVIGNLVASDDRACSPTQIARMPGSKNVKNVSEVIDIYNRKKCKRVSVVKNNAKTKVLKPDGRFSFKVELEKNNIFQYDIDKLYNNFVVNENNVLYTSDNNLRYGRKGGLPPCAIEIIHSGVKKGFRYKTLPIIVVTAKNGGLTMEETIKVVSEFNKNCNPPELNDVVISRTTHIYNNQKYVALGCNDCTLIDECKRRGKKVEGDLITDIDYSCIGGCITYNEVVVKHLKSKRKGVVSMCAKGILIYSVLKHTNGADFDKLTYKGECKYSDRFLKSVLKSLIDNKFVELIDGIYMLTKKKLDKNRDFNIAIAGIYDCIKGGVREEDLALYVYIKYKHIVACKEEDKPITTLVYIDRTKIGKDLGKSSRAIGDGITRLVDEKLLSFTYKTKSKKSDGNYYNMYLLNY